MISINAKKALSFTLALVISASLIPAIGTPLSVKAAGEKSVAGLGTAAISDPKGNGQWDYVYYGSFNGSDVRYRVLDKDSNDFGSKTILLDCDNILQDLTPGNSLSNKLSSDDLTGLMRQLNGSAFLDKPDVFTDAEKKAIAYSTKTSRSATDGTGKTGEFAQLTKNKIFALDPSEASNATYGYKNTGVLDLKPDDNGLADANRKKSYLTDSTKTGTWWLRLQESHRLTAIPDECYLVNDLGIIRDEKVTKSAGMSPAFNVSLSSVLFSSKVPNSENEFKLTVIDDSMLKPEFIEGTKTGNNIDISFEYPQKEIDNTISFSVLLLKDKYTAGISKTTDYAYIPLKNVTKLTGQGDPVPTFTKITGSFTLPNGCENYNAYLISEKINGDKKTDYASSPVRFDLDKRNHRHSWKITDSRGDRLTTAADKVAVISCTECHNVKYTVSLDATSKVYDGKTPKVEVKKSEGFPAEIVVSDVVYKLHNDSRTITAAEASNVGEYDAVIGITAGTETSELKDDYKIEPRTITPEMITLSQNEYVYDGQEKRPGVTVKLDETVLTENTDYTVEYKDNINPGLANVIVTAKSSNFTGKGVKTFKIDNPETNVRQDAEDLVNKVKDKRNKDDKTGETTANKQVEAPQVENPAPKHQVGDTIIDNGDTYIITSVNELDLTVTYVKPGSDNVKTAEIPLSIFDDNIEYRVTEIADNAFKGNKSLKKVTIDENVNKIGTNAFYKCKNLKSIKIKTTELTKKTVGKNAFKKISKKAKVKVPKSKYKSYKKLLKSKGINGENQKITK